VAGEKSILGDNLLRLISESVDDFEQFCTKECKKKKPLDHNWELLKGDEMKLNNDGIFQLLCEI
jgi:hypothetical protein